jgi:hypothetical protein
MAYLIYYLVSGKRTTANPVRRADFVETCRCSTTRFSHCHLAKSTPEAAKNDSITTMVNQAEWDEFLEKFALGPNVEAEMATLAKWPVFQPTKGLHIYWGCCEHKSPGLSNSIVLGVVDEYAIVHFEPEVGKDWTRQAAVVKMNHCPLASPGALGLPSVVPRTSSKRWISHWTAWLGDIIDREAAVNLSPDAVMSYAEPGWLERRAATVGATISVSQHTYTELPRIEASKYSPTGLTKYVAPKKAIVHELDGVACKRVCTLATTRFGDPLLECVLPGQSVFDLVLGKDGHPAFMVGGFFFRSIQPDITTKPLSVVGSVLLREQQRLVFRGVITEPLTKSLKKSVTETDLAHDVNELVQRFKCPKDALTWLCLRHLNVGWKVADNVGHWVCECHQTENPPMILVLWGPGTEADLTFGDWFGSRQFAIADVNDCIPKEQAEDEQSPEPPGGDMGQTWVTIGDRSLTSCFIAVTFMIVNSGVAEAQVESVMQTAFTRFLAELPASVDVLEQTLQPIAMQKLAALCEANLHFYDHDSQDEVSFDVLTDYARSWHVRVGTSISCRLAVELVDAVARPRLRDHAASLGAWLEILAMQMRPAPANNLGTYAGLSGIVLPRTKIALSERVNDWNRDDAPFDLPELEPPAHLSVDQAVAIIETVFTWATRSCNTRLAVLVAIGTTDYCRQLALLRALIRIDPTAIVTALNMTELDEMADAAEADLGTAKMDYLVRADLEFADVFKIPATS